MNKIEYDVYIPEKKIACLFDISVSTKLDIPEFRKFFNKGKVYIHVEEFTHRLDFETDKLKHITFELVRINPFGQIGYYTESQ